MQSGFTARAQQSVGTQCVCLALLVAMAPGSEPGHHRPGEFDRGFTRKQHVEFGDVNVTDPEVMNWVQHTRPGQISGHPQQLPGPIPGDLLRDTLHMRTGGKVTGGVLSVQVPGVHRHQPPDGIQQVSGGSLPRMAVAHSVGKHRREFSFGGVGPHPAGHGCGQIRTWPLLTPGTRCGAVADDLHVHVVPGQIPPAL